LNQGVGLQDDYLSKGRAEQRQAMMATDDTFSCMPEGFSGKLLLSPLFGDNS
jgi:hypothetical protein